MTARVSEITSGDRSALSGLLSRIAQFKPDEVDVALELIDAALSDPAGSGYECLVAREGEHVVGYICTGPTPMTEATWDLYWIAVDPDIQGRGIGRALYAAFVERMQARGGRQVRIETSSKEVYAATGGFYERLGFSIDGRLRDFYAPGDDLLIFYRRLS
ncbi:MAG: putative acetyltransferase [Myxococcaceae bacterium]|nr:putative acetyltransferase [Myxococcaceae bacterium]